MHPDRAAYPPAARPEPPVPYPDADTPFYSVGQVADMLDVQPAFLRRLDTEHVVMPSRSSGGQRRYSRTDIDRVHAVTGLLAEGMTLAGALRIMELQAEIADLRRQLSDRQTKR